MATATSTLVRYQDPEEVRERAAVAGFLAGYSGNTRISYTTDLRLFAGWCADYRLRVLEVRRARSEIFARAMEEEGRMRSTVARRLSTLCSLFRYCHVEGFLDRNPAANVRRPRVDCESRTIGLDHNELGAPQLHHRRLDAGVPLRDVQEAASHADVRTTMRYDRARQSDRHATYIVAAFVAGSAR